MNLKVSKFTQVFQFPDGLCLAYNSLTSRYIELTGEQGARWKPILSVREQIVAVGDSSFATSPLVDAGLLVHADINETNVVKEMRRLGRPKKGPPMLTILPTLGCNFACDYCFERHEKGLMSAAVQNALLRFAASRLIEKGTELKVEWFGGEPLIGIKVIESVMTGLAQICAERKAPPPSGSIVTNGYLLGPNMFDRLMILGIDTAQITIDGTPAIHDRRRRLVSGRGTFHRIIENIGLAPAGFDIGIRINVDHGNKHIVFELLSLLAEEVPRATPYLAPVESFSGECASSTGHFMTPEEYSSFRAELNERCATAGVFVTPESPRNVVCGYCTVDSSRGFVVQPDGKLLKCWAESGNEKASPVADLLDEDTWRHLRRSSLERRDPFDDPECCDCPVLPLCMGGCPRMRENHRADGGKVCPSIRYSVANVVRDSVESLLGRGKRQPRRLPLI